VNRRPHLHRQVSALVDGELGHDARDRALAHLTHCPSCWAALEAERGVKARVRDAATPAPSEELLARLLAMAEPGDPLPPRERVMPLAPVVPTLPPPGRLDRAGRPRGRRDGVRPGTARRARLVAAGALCVGVLTLGTAFAAGGGRAQPGEPVLPPAAELSVEHAATSAGLPLSDPAFEAVTASFGGLTFPSAAPARTAGR
jgi:hypothetical protein